MMHVPVKSGFGFSLNVFMVNRSIGCVIVMGDVRVRAVVANSLDHDLEVELEFLVDTGAIYTMLTKSVAEKLQLKELGKRKFKTGGGVVELPVSEAYLMIDGEGVTSLVAIGEEGMPLLLGVTTLELLGLQVDPVSGKLKPLDLMIL
jgi:aspartyl protease family protein